MNNQFTISLMSELLKNTCNESQIFFNFNFKQKEIKNKINDNYKIILKQNIKLGNLI